MPRSAANPFTVHIYRGEMDFLVRHVLDYDHIETGGDLFGLWMDDRTLVVQLVCGPGKDCHRTTISFHQDVTYLGRIGDYLTKKEGLCNVGEWHSHHRLGLARPSPGDESTVWQNMPTSLSKFVVFIANITHNDHVNVGCFLFDKVTNRVVPGDFVFIESYSPLRKKDTILETLNTGAENLPATGSKKRKGNKTAGNNQPEMQFVVKNKQDKQAKKKERRDANKKCKTEVETNGDGKAQSKGNKAEENTMVGNGLLKKPEEMVENGSLKKTEEIETVGNGLLKKTEEIEMVENGSLKKPEEMVENGLLKKTEEIETVGNGSLKETEELVGVGSSSISDEGIDKEEIMKPQGGEITENEEKDVTAQKKNESEAVEKDVDDQRNVEVDVDTQSSLENSDGLSTKGTASREVKNEEKIDADTDENGNNKQQTSVTEGNVSATEAIPLQTDNQGMRDESLQDADTQQSSETTEAMYEMNESGTGMNERKQEPYKCKKQGKKKNKKRSPNKNHSPNKKKEF